MTFEHTTSLVLILLSISNLLVWRRIIDLSTTLRIYRVLFLKLCRKLDISTIALAKEDNDLDYLKKEVLAGLDALKEKGL